MAYGTLEETDTTTTMATQTFTLQAGNNSITETFLGLVALGCFIIIWVSSICFPFLLYAAIHFEAHFVTATLLFLLAAAYLPWNAYDSTIGTSVRWFVNHYNSLYYKKCTVLFKGDSLPQGKRILTTTSTSSSTTSSTSSETKDGKNTKPLFYAVHPHGAFCLGWSVLFISNTMQNVRFCFSPVLYYTPFFRLFCLMTGHPGKADKASMISYMKNGENIALPPGGFEEATITSTTQDRVYIKKRAGFIKLCLQHGYSVVPTYSFGEKSTFANVQGHWKLRHYLNSLGIPTIMIWGAWYFPFFPKRSEHGLYVVSGEPLDLPKVESPTKEDVKKWHDAYMAALLKIFEDHKCDAYGEEGKGLKLEFW